MIEAKRTNQPTNWFPIGSPLFAWSEATLERVTTTVSKMMPVCSPMRVRERTLGLLSALTDLDCNVMSCSKER